MRQHGVSQEGKKLRVLHELGNKMQWGRVGGGLSGCIVSPSMCSVGEQGTKPLKNVKYLA